MAIKCLHIRGSANLSKHKIRAAPEFCLNVYVDSKIYIFIEIQDKPSHFTTFNCIL